MNNTTEKQNRSQLLKLINHHLFSELSKRRLRITGLTLPSPDNNTRLIFNFLKTLEYGILFSLCILSWISSCALSQKCKQPKSDKNKILDPSQMQDNMHRDQRYVTCDDWGQFLRMLVMRAKDRWPNDVSYFWALIPCPLQQPDHIWVQYASRILCSAVDLLPLQRKMGCCSTGANL